MTHLFPRANAKVPVWAFNGEFGRNFAAVVDLQMWCLGCDIKREAGNLLVEYGFSRRRPTGEITGCSHYFKEVDSNHTIHLWGFAVVITTQECGLCLRRYERAPLFSRNAAINQNAWRPQDIPKFKYPRTESEKLQAAELLEVCVYELKKYESMVQSLEKPQYRPSCLRDRRRTKALREISLLEAWTELYSAIGEAKHANI